MMKESINAEDELMKILSEEIAKEIDKEIINSIFSKENIRKAKIKDLFPEKKWN